MASSQAIKAGEAYVQLYAEDRALVRGLKAASNTVAGYSSKLKKLETAGIATFTKMGLGVAAVAAPLALMAGKFADYGGKFEDMAFRTGMSTEALTEYAYVAQMTGTSIEEFEGAVRSMQSTLLGAVQGKKKAVEVLDLLGMSYRQLADLSPEQQFETLFNAISEIEDPTLRAGMAMKVFGGSGAKLLPMLNEGADGVARWREEAKQLGLSMSGEDAASAARLGDSMDRLKAAFLGVTLTLGAALAPVMTDVFERIAPMIGEISQFISNNRELVATIVELAAKGLVVAGIVATLGMAFSSALGPVRAVMMSFAFITGKLLPLLIPLFSTLAGAIGTVTLPIWGIVAAVTAAVGAFLYFSGVGGVLLRRITEGFSALYNGFMDSFGAIVNAIKAGDWQAAWEVAWTGLKALWSAGLQWLWDTFIESFTVGGEFVKNCLAAIGQMFNGLIASIFGAEVAAWFEETATVIMDTLGVAFTWIMDAWTMVSTAFINGLSYVWEFIAVWVTRVVSLFQFLFGKYFEFVAAFYKGAFRIALDIGSFVIGVIKNIGSILSWIIARIGDVINFIVNVATSIFSTIYSIGKPVFDLLLSVAGWIGSAFKAGFTIVWNIVKSIISAVSTLAGWALKFIDRLTGADKKIAEIQDKAQQGREDRSEAAAETIAARHALDTGELEAVAATTPGTPPPAITPSPEIAGTEPPELTLEIPALEPLAEMDELIGTDGLKTSFSNPAIDDWEKAMEKANSATAAESLTLPGVDSKKTRQLRGLADGDPTKEAKTKMDSVGTFSAFAAASLGNDAGEETAKNTAETVRLLTKISRNGGGIGTFG